jgi:hypothetical protein
MPNPMLILLNARARSMPSRFALSDYRLAQLMKLRPALLEPDSMRSGNTVHPTIGMHILILQDGMLQFLVDFGCEMLPDKLDEPIFEPPDTDLELPDLSDNNNQ